MDEQCQSVDVLFIRLVDFPTTFGQTMDAVTLERSWLRVNDALEFESPFFEILEFSVFERRF